MKKLILPFLILAVFLFKIDNVEAITGGHTYDITSVLLGDCSGKECLKISGWAYINDASGNSIHNIQPNFTFNLVGMDANGKTISTTPYTVNHADRPAYDAANSTPKDFTKAYFTKGNVGGTYYTYPESGSQRADVIYKMMNLSPYYNKFAININFEFHILISDFITMYENVNIKKFRMDLVVNMVSNKNVKVYGYGKSFETKAITKTIQKIGIQANRINGGDPVISTKSGIVLSFEDLINKVTVVATYGQARPHWSLDWYNYYYFYDNIMQIKHLYDKPAGAITMYYYNSSMGEEKATYTLTGTQVVDTALAAAKFPVYTYNVNISPTTDKCWGGRCVANEGDFTAWIPSFWVVPYTQEGTFIRPLPTTCVDKPECKTLGSTTKCPASTTCCKEICSIAANKNSHYCKEDCGGKKEEDKPKVDPCDDIDDPMKHYCCVYPQDKQVCDQPGGTFPETDPTDNTPGVNPINKTGTCKTSGSTDVIFKYPQEGWGAKMVSNTACSISCSEKLKATFQSSRSVRAGMGWEYPVTINSSRYCTADYDNDDWVEENNDAAEDANEAYEEMLEYIEEAAELDEECGTKETLIDEDEPECDDDCEYRSYGSCMKCPVKTKSCPKCGEKTNSKGQKTGCKSCYLGKTQTEAVDCDSGYRYAKYLNGKKVDACILDVCSKDNDIEWDERQDDIDDLLDDADDERKIYNKNVATINKLNNDRATCDNYVSDKKYSGATGTEIDTINVPKQSEYEITSSTRNEDSSYEKARKKTATQYTVYECKSIKYTAPSMVGDHKSRIKGYSGTYCDFQPKTKTYYDYWNKKTDAKVELEFATEYYVQRYTGNLNTYSSSGYDYDGRKSYTGFYEFSTKHTFMLETVDIGPNVQGVSNDLWSIDPFTCNYRVNNLIFPPKGDTNNDKYGNVAFMYRQVSLTDPFPDREPGENWDGYSSLITSNGYKVYSNKPLYTIRLSPTTMQDIRGYGSNYGSYYTSNPYRSMLVEKYIKNGVILKGK